MKHQQLLDLLRSPEFNRLALDSVSQEANPDTRWWDLHVACVERQAEMSIWTTAQYIKLLFETYPTEIKRIRLELSVEKEDDEMVPKNDLFINERFCAEHYNEFEDEDEAFLEVIQECDDAQVFDEAISVIGETITSHVEGSKHKILAAFKESFMSPGQVDTMLAQHAPFVKAWADAQLLGQVAKSNQNPDRVMSCPAGITKL